MVMHAKRTYRKEITTGIMYYCFISLTIGKFVPVYFVNENLRLYYHIAVITGLSFCTALLLPSALSNSTKLKKVLDVAFRVIVCLGVFAVLMFFLLLGSLASWTTAGTYYVSKTNPDIKIISRYVNLGAWGGGTSPDDYETVLERPLTPLFVLVTKIDTNKINKDEWKKPDQ